MLRLLLNTRSLWSAAILSGMSLGLIETAAAQEVERPSPVGVEEPAVSTPAQPKVSAAQSALPLPAMLARVAPTIAKVRAGSWWGTGVVFGSRTTIVTSYELVNRPGELQVVVADGVIREARVVAWSPSDDLAVLEMDAKGGPEPLRAAHDKLEAGSEAVLLYEPRDPQLSPDKSGGWVVPLARFTRISRATADEVNLDMTVWGLIGDDGAAVVSPAGELVGIISRRTAKERRTIMTPVARIERLLPMRDRQGEFSPPGQGHWFGGVFGTPIYSTIFDQQHERTAFIGLGVDEGYRYDRLFAGLSLGFFQSDHHRVNATEVQALDRLQVDLAAGGEFEILHGLDAFAGPGLSLVLDTLETSSVNQLGALHVDQSTRARVRPLIELGFAAGPFFLRDIFTLADPGEVRIDLGFALRSRIGE